MAGEDSGLPAGEDDMPIYVTFRPERFRCPSSTGSLEPLNREVNRCANVRGVFLKSATALRLVGLVLIEVDDG